MSHDALHAACLAAIGPVDAEAVAGPLQPFKNLVQFIKDQAGTVSKDVLVMVAEGAWDFIAQYNFPQVPDAIEVPLKAWLKSQIRPLIDTFYA